MSAGRGHAAVHNWGAADLGWDAPGPASLPPGAEDMQQPVSPATTETAEQVKRLAGLADPVPPQRSPEHPDVHGLAEGLGLA